MAYTPATLTLNSWTSPLTIQATDLLSGLDNAMNVIIDSSQTSVKNFINTEMAKVPAYLASELVKLDNENLATLVATQASATQASASASAAAQSAIDAANVMATYLGIDWSTFSVVDGEFIINYLSTTSTPSIVNGELIITS